jgi:hypothetical protein
MQGGKAMANANSEGARRKSHWRVAGWTLAGLFLLVPLVAMWLTGEVSRTAGDFIFAAVLIGLAGIIFELTSRISADGAYRGGVATALTASILIAWANGAVGMIGNGDDPYNLMFLGVIAIALLGSLLSRLRPAGMAWTMAAAGAAQAALGLGGMQGDVRGGIMSTLLAGLWLVAAALFRNSADSIRSPG